MRKLSCAFFCPIHFNDTLIYFNLIQNPAIECFKQKKALHPKCKAFSFRNNPIISYAIARIDQLPSFVSR